MLNISLLRMFSMLCLVMQAWSFGSFRRSNTGPGDSDIIALRGFVKNYWEHTTVSRVQVVHVVVKSNKYL